ncbi:MAG: cyclase family protein [Gammaproteobacteria bacterium]
MRVTVAVCLMATMLVPAVLAAQTRESGPWWPQPEWGADDESGATNRITPQKVIEAMGVVTTGEIYDLGHPLESGMPALFERTYSIQSSSRGAAIATNQYVGQEEFLAGQLGHLGTQLDSFAHAGREVEMEDGTTEQVFYNGFTGREMDTRYGFSHLGVENIKPIVTRGVLIDIAGYKGERLPHGYEVTVEDLEGALARQGLSDADFSTGDAIIFRYGWAQLWDQPDVVMTRGPGIGPAVGEWVIERSPAIFGSDSGSQIAVPGGAGGLHQQFLTFNGIPMAEYMNLERLAEDEVYEFMFIVTPLPLVGATGSPIRPLAIR